MAYAATDNLDRLLLATERASRKFANLSAEPGVALLIDSRANGDLTEALAVTVMGRAQEVNRAERGGPLPLYVASRFRRVMEMRPAD